MTPNTGSAPAPAAPPAAAVPPVVATPPAVDLTAHQRQIDELRAQVEESQRTAQYWADKAKGGEKPPAAVDEDDSDVLEAITTGGGKGLDALLAKRGYMKRSEVEQSMDARVAGITAEQKLTQEYPALNDKDSDFFKATARTYGQLVKSGTPGAVAMRTAARDTELEFLRAGKMKLPGELAAEKKETDRLARIAAQAGDGGGRRQSTADEDDDTITPDEQAAIKRLSEALEIPIADAEKRYKARAAKGVQIGLRLTK